MVSYVGLDGFACNLIIYFIASSSLPRYRGGSDEMACKLLIGEVQNAPVQIRRAWLAMVF